MAASVLAAATAQTRARPRHAGPRAPWSPNVDLLLPTGWDAFCVRTSTSRLADCLQLAPPFTGSSTTRGALRGLVGAEPRVPRHRLTVAAARALNASANCFVTTVREPLERVESGVRYRRTHNSTAAYARQAAALPTADLLVAAWRDPAHPQHQRAARLASGAAPGGEPPLAQRDFLRGLDGACGADVYALCTERLGAELATLGTAFGAPIRARWLQRRAADDAARVHDAAARAWVRRTMADDARLHEALCATPRPDAGGDEKAPCVWRLSSTCSQ